jgi:hypothetical protein
MLDHVSITASDIAAAERFYDAIMKALGVCVFVVIARSPCDEAIHLSLRGEMDCLASLAMTVQNRLLKNRDPFNPYRHGRSTALVMPIRIPMSISGFSVRACSAIGG